MTSYEAYLTYPVEVARMQELEPKISGGTTVVLAVVCGSTLYVANVGDSRAVLVNENEKGLQQVLQMSVDHGVENIDEMKRLVDLGLDREQLKRSGRLGSQENTRSIGDYSIKGGYKDVDTLQHCKAQPGLCEPYVDVIPLTPHCKYIILMTDGVYKSIEEPFQQKAGIDTNKVLMTTVNHESDQLVAQKRRFNVLADRVLGRIRAIHEDAYKNNAAQDVRSPVAVACRKRDDMTLLVHQFAI
jgi:TAK1-binding protein 1